MPSKKNSTYFMSVCCEENDASYDAVMIELGSPG